jgi:putative transposase
MITYKFKLYSCSNLELLRRQITIAGQIRNHCIRLQKTYYRLTKKYISLHRMQKHIAKLRKKGETKQAKWKHLGSQAVQEICERVDRGYQLFFNAMRKNISRKIRPPKEKKPRRNKSFTLKQAGWKLLGGNRLRVGKLEFKFSKSREIEGKIKTVTISRNPIGEVFVCFVCEKEYDKPNALGNSSVGIDFGLKTFLTLSNGLGEVEAPQFLKTALRGIRKESQNISRKIKGSKGYRKAIRKLARLHEKIVNKRKDWQTKCAKAIVERFDYIFLEDLNLYGMQRIWGRKISDLAYGEFVGLLEWQAKKLGKVVHKISRFYPSSKTCNSCGHIHGSLKLKDRLWRCPCCGIVHDRDENAANNIECEGASSLGLVGGRPAA